MAIVMGTIALEKGLRAEFMKSYDAQEKPSDIYAFILPTRSTGSGEEYGWLGSAPSMSEWIDERKLKALNSFDYRLKNKDYEATLQVHRNEIEDDQMGAIKTRIGDLASKARVAHPRKQFFALLERGEIDLCYDGQPMFSNSHQEGDSGVQSNVVTGTGTATYQAIIDDLDKAIVAMKGFKDDVGEPRNEGDITIGVVCSEQLEMKFKRLNVLEFIAPNVENPYKGRLSVVTSSARLTDKNDFYVANINKGTIAPVIHQTRKDVTFEALDKSESAFMRKINYYGVDSREAWGYGLWSSMVKVKNA